MTSFDAESPPTRSSRGSTWPGGAWSSPVPPAGSAAETARAMAARGGFDHLVARSADRAPARRPSWKCSYPAPSVERSVADLADAGQLRAFAESVPFRPRRHRRAHQQRRCHGLPVRPHRRRLRDAVRHQPPRPLPTHGPAVPGAASGRGTEGRDPQLGRSLPQRRRPRRPQLRPTNRKFCARL